MTAAEFVYSVILRPKVLRTATNACLRAIVPRQITRYGGTVVLNPNDPVISGALTLNVYEKVEMRFFERVCRPGMCFIDIGANVGLYTAIAHSRIGSTGRIVAIEPDIENFEYLKRTVAANSGSNVVCIPKAVADRIGRMKLFVSADNRGDNRLYANELCGSSYDVDVTTVDALVKELHLDRVDLIKMDVQGFEGHVLRGMVDLIAKSPSLLLLTEFWPDGLRRAGDDPTEILSSLERQGMRLHELNKRGEVVPLVDKGALVERYPGREYTNIVALKGRAAV